MQSLNWGSEFMGVVVRGALFFLVLSLCGCFSVVTDQAEYADAIAERGDWESAELAYISAMSEPLVEEEWQYIFEQRCKVRTQIARQRLEEIQGGSPTLEEVLEFESYIRKCPSFVDFEAPAADVKIRVIEGFFRENIDPLVAQGKVYEALKASHEYTPHLMEENPRNISLAEIRARFAQDQKTKSQAVAAYPTLRAAHLWIGSFAGTYEAPPPTKPTEDFLAVWRRSIPQIEVGEGCAAFPIGVGKPEGLPYDILSVKVTDCKKNVTVSEGDEEYTDYETKTEYREVVNTTVTPVTTTTVTHHQSCSGTMPCRTTHTTSSSVTVDRYSTSTEWVEVPIRVPVQRIRKAKYGTATRSAKLALTLRSEDGEKVVNHTITLFNRSKPFPLNSSDSSIREFDRDIVLTPSFIEQMTSETIIVARREAVNLRRETLFANYEGAKLGGDANATLDRALMVWFSGTRSEELAAAINEAFPVALTSFEPTQDHVIPPYLWAPGVVNSDFFEFTPRPFEITATMNAYQGINGTVRIPETFLGQPDRSSVQGDFSSRMRFIVSKEGRYKVFGLLLGFDLGLSLGSRMGDDYESLEESGIFMVEEEEELGITFGMEGSAVLGAGLMSKHLGFFAGVKPTYTSYKIGHFFSEGGMVPLLGRLEFRGLESPIIFEGTWGDLTEAGELGEPTRFGASLDLPLSKGLWLRAIGTHQVLPARFYGVNEQDDVYVKRAKVQTYSLGLSFTLW